MKYWRVKEFSELVGVSIKTLHYYDKTELLKPSSKDRDSGYRQYSEDSLKKIQQIIALKSFGFSLLKIKQIADEQISFFEQLQAQERVLVEQIRGLNSAHKTLRLIMSQQQTNGAIAPNDLIKLIKEYEMEKELQQSWKNILPKDQFNELEKVQEQAKNIFKQSLDKARTEEIWMELCETVSSNLNNDPESLIGEDLAIRWMGLIHLMFGANKSLQKQISETLEKDNHNNKQENDLSFMKPEIVEWIKKAIKFHKLD